MLCYFIMEMALNPDVQKRAQAEIDRIIGNDRLPTFDDRSKLPYVDCIIKETMRCSKISPIGESMISQGTNS